VAAAYPIWKHYPSRTRPPAWVEQVVGVFALAEATVSSLKVSLVRLGFEVEAGKKRAEKLRRPVLFGELGDETQAYEVDAIRLSGSRWRSKPVAAQGATRSSAT
jgi:hypothetical protein